MDNQNLQNQIPTAQPPQPETNANQPINNTSSQVSQNGVPVGQQYPVSASQMGLNQPTKSKIEVRKFLKPLIITISVLFVIAIGWFVFKSMSGYGTKTVQADGFSYNVYFDKRAKLETAQGKTYLDGKDSVTGKQMLVSVSKAVQSNSDCFETSTTSIISKPSIDGEQHNFCYSKSVNAYAMNFTHNNEWYVLAIFGKNKADTMDQETAKSIAESVQIN